MTDIQQESFYRKLIRLVLPIAVQNLFTALVSAADTIMLSMLPVQPDELETVVAAVNAATRVSFVVNFIIIFGITAGISVMAAQYWGKGDRNTVERVQCIALRYTVSMTFAVFLLCLICPEWLIRLFTQDQGIIEKGADYLRIVCPSYLFLGVSQVFLTIMKNTGRVLRSSIYSTTKVVLNIILNYLLIFNILGLEKFSGISGAALATSIACGVELILCVYENFRQRDVRFRPSLLVAKSPRLHREFWRYTWPLLANTIAWGGGTTMFTAILGQYDEAISKALLSALAISNIVKDCCDCLGSGIATGAAIMLGNQLGRNELDQARADGRRFVRLSLVVGVASGLVLLAVSGLVTDGVNLEKDAKDYLKVMLYISSYYMIGRVLNTMLINGIFSAGGDTKFGFWCDLANLWGVIIPAAILAASVLSLPPMWVYFILYLDEFTKIPVEYIHYKKYRWLRNITMDAQQS